MADVFLRKLAELRALCPTVLPVVVRRRVLSDDIRGVAWLVHDRQTGDPRHFRVDVERSMPLDQQLETLYHEWSHCLAWPTTSRLDDHGPAWGIAYAFVYGSMIES